jgi:hypothetical protein
MEVWGVNPLTVDEILRLSREFAQELNRGRRKCGLWRSRWCDRDALYVIDTRQIPIDPQLKALSSALKTEDPYPEDTLLVVMHPLDVTELREKYLDVGTLFPVTDAWIASTVIDWVIAKKPELKEKWGW